MLGTLKMTLDNTLEAMEPVDILRSAALMVGIGVSALGSRATWIQADVLLSVSLGLGWLLFPEVMLDFQTVGKLDTLHILYGRLFGVWLLSTCLIWILNRRTKDDNVWAAQIAARVITNIALLQSMVISHSQHGNETQRWSLQHITFGMVAVGLWLLGSLKQLVTFGDVYRAFGQANTTFRTRHLLMDAVILTCMVISSYCLPEVVINQVKSVKVDAIHIQLVRACGSMAVGMLVCALAALNYGDEEARKNHLLVRMLSHLVAFVFVMYSQWRSHMGSQYAVELLVASTCVVSFNCLCGYFGYKMKRE